VDADYTQPGDLYRLMPADEKIRLIENIVGALKNVPKNIQEKMVVHFTKADPEYGEGVAKGIGL
jgi:catalase